MAQPPTVTHMPIAKPKYSERAFLTVATESTTKARIMHISDAAMENAPAAEPLSTLRPTVSTSM